MRHLPLVQTDQHCGQLPVVRRRLINRQGGWNVLPPRVRPRKGGSRNQFAGRAATWTPSLPTIACTPGPDAWTDQAGRWRHDEPRTYAGVQRGRQPAPSRVVAETRG